MSFECGKDACLEGTGFHYTRSFIQGKYKILSSTLKELQAVGFVHRKEYPQIPPKVEYSLTERGKSRIPILDQMYAWGEEHRPV